MIFKLNLKNVLIRHGYIEWKIITLNQIISSYIKTFDTYRTPASSIVTLHIIKSTKNFILIIPNKHDKDLFFPLKKE